MKVISIQTDRVFTCPRCSKKHQPGDTISFVVSANGKDKVRYCEDCALAFVSKASGNEPADLADIRKRLDALESKPSTAQTSATDVNVGLLIEQALKKHFAEQPAAPQSKGMVTLENYAIQQAKIWKALDEITARLDALE